MPASPEAIARRWARINRLAYLVGEVGLPLTIAAERLGVSNQLAAKDMKLMELKVFGFNEQVRKSRKQC